MRYSRLSLLVAIHEKQMLKRITAVCLMAIIIVHTPAYANSILCVSARARTALVKGEEFMVEAAATAEEEFLLLTAPGVDDDEEPSPPAEGIDSGLEIFYEESAIPETEQEEELELTSEEDLAQESVSAEDVATDSIDTEGEEEKIDQIQEP